MCRHHGHESRAPRHATHGPSAHGALGEVIGGRAVWLGCLWGRPLFALLLVIPAARRAVPLTQWSRASAHRAAAPAGAPVELPAACTLPAERLCVKPQGRSGQKKDAESHLCAGASSAAPRRRPRGRGAAPRAWGVVSSPIFLRCVAKRLAEAALKACRRGDDPGERAAAVASVAFPASAALKAGATVSDEFPAPIAAVVPPPPPPAAVARETSAKL